MASNDATYAIDSIEVLSGIEAVRRRPGMYIGDVQDGSGLHHALWELVSNALDEHLAGHASRIRVSVEGQLAEVEDDGRGIPVVPEPRTGVSVVEYLLTQLHCGPTADGHLPHVHIGPTGVGLAAVNALAESLEIEVRRDGWSWHQRYARGVPLGALERGERTNRTGTRVRWLADRSIFGDAPFDRAEIRRRLRELAAFNPSLTFELMAERIREPRGILALVDSLSNGAAIHAFATRGVRDGVRVEVGLGWADGEPTRIRSYVGQRATEDGGSHEHGFWQGLIAAVADPRTGASRRPPRGERARRRLAGLQAIVHVDLRAPRFGGPTRSRFVHDVVGAVVRRHVADAYRAHLRERPALGHELVRRLSSAVLRTRVPCCAAEDALYSRHV